MLDMRQHRATHDKLTLWEKMLASDHVAIQRFHTKEAIHC
jgi:hypothetical protein